MSPRRWVLLVLMAVGVLAGLPQIARRVRVEAAAHNVDIVADETAFVGLAQAYGIPPLALLRRLKAAGVGALAVPEDTLASLGAQGRVSVLSSDSWEAVTAPGGAFAPAAAVPGTLQAFLAPYVAPPAAAGAPVPALRGPGGVGAAPGTYILADPGLAAWLLPALRGAVGPEVPVRAFSWRGRPGIYVDSPPEDVAALPLGFAPGAFALARAAGLRVVPRPEAVPGGEGGAAAMRLYAAVAAAGVPVEAVLYAGEPTAPLPGYPAALAATVRTFRSHRWLLGLLETPEQLGNVDQPGTRQLAAALGERVVRVYSVPPWILADPPSGVASAIFSQVTDFNVRLVYMHPLIGADPVSATLAAVAQASAALRADGYTPGPPQPFASIQPGRLERVLQGLAVVAAGLWLLELLVPPLGRYGYQPLAVLGAAVALLCLGSGHLSTLLVAFGAGLAGGGLSLAYFARRFSWPPWPENPTWGTVWRRSLTTTLGTAGITFCGALVIASLMGGTQFFLEWQYFRGVKLTFVAIPLLAGLAFLAFVGIGAEPGAPVPDPFPLRTQIRAVWAQPVRIKHVAAVLLLAVIGAIYLIRSGNAPAAFVPALEVHLRDLLQRVFTYRPRFKDFLVGYPSAMVAGFFAARRRRWPFLFFLLGTSVGQVALVDSFATLRTPFVHSVLREGWGLVVGALLGTLAVAALQLLWAALQAPRPRSGAPAPLRATGAEASAAGRS